MAKNVFIDLGECEDELHCDYFWTNKRHSDHVDRKIFGLNLTVKKHHQISIQKVFSLFLIIGSLNNP